MHKTITGRVTTAKTTVEETIRVAKGGFRLFPRPTQDGYWFPFSGQSSFFRHDTCSAGRPPNRRRRSAFNVRRSAFGVRGRSQDIGNNLWVRTSVKLVCFHCHCFSSFVSGVCGRISVCRKLRLSGSKYPSRSQPIQTSSWLCSFRWRPTCQPARPLVRKTFCCFQANFPFLSTERVAIRGSLHCTSAPL